MKKKPGPSDVNITTDGRKFLGSFIGTKEASDIFVREKIVEWKKTSKHSLILQSLSLSLLTQHMYMGPPVDGSLFVGQHLESQSL